MKNTTDTIRAVGSSGLVRPRRRSPIDALIDKACGYVEPDEPEPRRTPTADEKAFAAQVASRVISHITDMYPQIWENVPTSARLSVRNTVINSVTEELLSRANSDLTEPCTHT